MPSRRKRGGGGFRLPGCRIGRGEKKGFSTLCWEVTAPLEERGKGSVSPFSISTPVRKGEGICPPFPFRHNLEGRRFPKGERKKGRGEIRTFNSIPSALSIGGGGEGEKYQIPQRGGGGKGREKKETVRHALLVLRSKRGGGRTPSDSIPQ